MALTLLLSLINCNAAQKQSLTLEIPLQIEQFVQCA